MKYIVILGDGMADYKLESLGHKTPLEYAAKPTIDALAPRSEIGLCKTVPDGFKPGSDVANLSVLGYDPRQGYTGRSPLEAVSIGIALKDTDVTMRCNLVTVSDECNYEDRKLLDYSAGEISTAEAQQLIAFLKQHFDNKQFTLYSGISYRHCMVIDQGSTGTDLTPPHDITGKSVKGKLPAGPMANELYAMMRSSYDLLKDHPVNKARIAAGKNPANSDWFWGEGTKPKLENFEIKYGLKGGVISAVDLVKGIGMLSGMQIIDVEGATGNYDTNFQGKAHEALRALLNGLDFVYIHMEAPDECGHQGDIRHKIESIEKIDGVVKTIVEGLNRIDEPFRMLICPDHPTPICLRTHTADPIPYMIYDSRQILAGGCARYDEEHATQTGNYQEDGFLLMQKLLHA